MKTIITAKLKLLPSSAQFHALRQTQLAYRDAFHPNKGLLFVCQRCQYILHADLIGARTVALRTLLIRQDWMSTGVLSVRPDVSCDEAKAARLSRYAALRWSRDTSPLSNEDEENSGGEDVRAQFIAPAWGADRCHGRNDLRPYVHAAFNS